MPLPLPTPDTWPFYEACQKGELRFQRCSNCTAPSIGRRLASGKRESESASTSWFSRRCSHGRLCRSSSSRAAGDGPGSFSSRASSLPPCSRSHRSTLTAATRPDLSRSRCVNDAIAASIGCGTTATSRPTCSTACSRLLRGAACHRRVTGRLTAVETDRTHRMTRRSRVGHQQLVAPLARSFRGALLDALRAPHNHPPGQPRRHAEYKVLITEGSAGRPRLTRPQVEPRTRNREY